MAGRVFGAGKLAARVSGTLAVGGTLTCTVDPAFSGSPTYQWLRNGVAIAGQTASTLSVVSLDVGTVITCRVSGLIYTSTGQLVPDLTATFFRLTEAGDFRITEAGDNRVTE